MGVNHSIPDKAVSHKDETCFSAIPAFPDLMASRLAAFVHLGHRSGNSSPTTSELDTPKRKLSDPTEERISASVYRLPSSEGSNIQRELESIHRGQICTTISDDEFILLDPKHVYYNPSSVMSENNNSVVRPYFRPRPCVPMVIPPDGNDVSAEPILDFGHRLREDRQRRNGEFIPIRETDDENSIQEDPLAVQQPIYDPEKTGEVSTFKLKPRRSRNPWDYKFSL